MKTLIKSRFEESIQVQKKTCDAHADTIMRMAQDVVNALSKGNKIIFFGNGGSAADSQHLAAEFVGRFQKERKALAAIALTTNTSILTALGNDYGFDLVFVKQIEALGASGDIAFAISTSGKSRNVIAAVKAAKKKGMRVLSLTGAGGGELAKISDGTVVVPSENTARVQEVHICIGHILCELVENQFCQK